MPFQKGHRYFQKNKKKKKSKKQVRLIGRLKFEPVFKHFIRHPWWHKKYCPLQLLPEKRGPQCEYEKDLKFNVILCEMCPHWLKANPDDWQPH